MTIHQQKNAHDQEHTGAESLDGLVAELTDEFMERVEAGEQPDVEEYAGRHPAVADVLREVLPAVQLMRQRPTLREPVDTRLGPEVNGTLGDYRLVREIGRGGMGVVYEARQISLDRRVALKILPFAAALDPRRLERFKNEAQAAAQLHHAHIVPVHAVGCERGVWYYAMQIIEGQSLAEIIDQLRQQTGGGPASRVRTGSRDTGTASDDAGHVERRGAGTETLAGAALSTAYSSQQPSFIQMAVDLGIQAAEALEHAHSMDVVHRDIKPGNLLIDLRGNLWITDFGLARFREDTTITGTGDLLGTLGYMSPEQASGRRGVIDQRSDIYSLGATLYELLTLHPVFAEQNRAALLRRISTDEPVCPRRLNPAIPVDLETVILKAMAREPELRYASARELADDLRRFLDHRPILARRPGLLERLSKWSRRHRSLVMSGAVTLILLVAGLSVSTAMIAREQARTQKALGEVSLKQRATRLALAAEAEQREAAENNLQLAQRNFQQARGMLEFFMSIAEEELAEHNELYELRTRLLQESLGYYQDFIEQADGDEPLQAELAASHQRVARILHKIGSTPAARAALEEALLTQERLCRARPEDEELRRGLWSMYLDLGAFDGEAPIRLIGEESVQEHLQLTARQRRIVDELSQSFQSLYKKSADAGELTEIRKQFRDASTRTLDEIQDVLDVAQFERLRQIDLQQRGTYAWNDPGVAEALCLTIVQQIEIRDIGDETRRIVRECFRTGRREDVCRHIHRSQDRINAVLTEEQQVQWRRLLGEPFKLRQKGVSTRNREVGAAGSSIGPDSLLSAGVPSVEAPGNAG